MNPARRLVLVLPDEFSALARVLELNGQRGDFLQPATNPGPVPMVAGVGLASAVLAALTYGLLQEDAFNGLPPAERAEKIENRPKECQVPEGRLVGNTHLVDGALRFARHWVVKSYNRLKQVRSPETSWDPALMLQVPNDAELPSTWYTLTVAKRDRTGDLEVGPQGVVAGSLDEVGKTSLVPPNGTLRDPKQDGGITTIFSKDEKNRPVVEVARGSIELSRYVCLAPSKRQVIADLVRRFREFNPRETRHAVAGLLLAKSGAGKSHLVERLADTLGLRLLTINITNQNRREDLLSEFDRIVTDQAEFPNERLLVFVDEVNAKVAGRVVYDAFLTPLENGYYVRRGHRFHIKPCLWLFVGTGDEKNIRDATKGSDFVSRMAFDPLDMRGGNDDQVYTMQENVLIGAALALRQSSELELLHRDVITTLASLPADTSVRDIRRLVEAELRINRDGSGEWRKLTEDQTKLSDGRAKLLQDLKEYLGHHDWVTVRSGKPAR